jgi:YD repeat-containing protein
MPRNLLFASTLLLMSMTAKGGDLFPPPDLQGHLSDARASAEYAATVLHSLNELSARRRLTTLFPNEQSPFYGVQMNYVNVGKGNLTFVVRDLVRLDRVPIVFGRVYDSRKQGGSDFGPGWKLSVAESLRQVGGAWMYVDASNSEYGLRLDGSRVSSKHPQITGIRGGRFNGTDVVLEIGDLTKTFQRYEDGFQLVQVRDNFGNSISLSYTGGGIERISSSGGRYVAIRRDATGRIVGATDDAGRTIRYAYDSSGRLSEAHDLAGEAYRYSYDAHGYLSKLTDPRGEPSLVARFDETGRAIEMTSQHDAMAYRYDVGSTLVTNGMQQAARFWRHDTGLTQSIQDFAGGVSALQLDADLRVSQVTFDGTAVATAEYAGGQLSAISKSNGSSFETQRFAYDARGRLVRIGTAGSPLARYRYDERGNVVFAEDASGRRRFHYGRDGRLSAVQIDDFSLGIQTNGIGLVERVYWDSGESPSHDHSTASDGNAEAEQKDLVRLSLDISYNETDRVEALRFNAPSDSAESEYGYTARGFRELGRYDLLERTRQGGIGLSYDAVGNLIEWTYPGRAGGTISAAHTVGTGNQVLAVTPGGHQEFEHTFEYDANGRPVRVVQGGQREATFRYDELSRLTDVYLDGEHVLTSRHGPMDLDPVHEADHHTPFTTVDEPVASAVFGSLEEIAFTRTAGTPYRFVRFVPSMARFVVRDPLVAAPDAVAFASLKRRNLTSRASLNPTPLAGFDKPSSSFFIPPEYFSVNCWYCIYGADGFDVDRVGPGLVPVGQTVNFVADALYAYCYLEHYDPETMQSEYFSHRFAHDITVNDDPITTLYGPFGYENHEYLEFGLSFSTPGTKTVGDTLRCAGCPSIFLAQAEDDVEVCQDPYAFHNPIWTYDTPLSHVTKLGVLSAGQLSVQVKVYTSTQLKFDWFQSYVTNRWNKTVTGAGVNLAVSISFQRVASVGEADLQVDYPPSSPINPVDPDTCGYHNAGTTPHSIVVYADGSGQGCDEGTTSAHEYGHHLGFKNAYTQPPPSTLHCDQNDVMSWGNVVQWYHGRILWERY